MLDKAKAERGFTAIRLGDKFNKPYILAFATDRTAKGVREAIGRLYAAKDEGETLKDGWRKARKEGRIRVRPCTITLGGKP